MFIDDEMVIITIISNSISNKCCDSCPGVGTHFEPDPYEDRLPKKIDPGHRGKLLAGHDRS